MVWPKAIRCSHAPSAGRRRRKNANWSGWAAGCHRAQSDVNTGVFAKNCPFVALAYRLNRAGLSWGVGAPADRPLAQLVNHWDSRAPDTHARSVIAAGADVEAIAPAVEGKDVRSPARRLWEVEFAARSLHRTVPEVDAKRPRPRM